MGKWASEIAEVILGDRNSTRKKNLANVVHALAEELTFADLQRHTSGLEQREHLFSMLNAALELVREDQYINEVYYALLQSHTGKDEVQAALQCGQGVLQSRRH